MSSWQAEKEERNTRSLARLTQRLPAIFPPVVLARALGRPFIPPTPRLAIDSYWGAHPLRADHLARALARRTGSFESGPGALLTVREANYRAPSGRPPSHIESADTV